MGTQTMESWAESIDIGNVSLLHIDKFCYLGNVIGTWGGGDAGYLYDGLCVGGGSLNS